MTGGKSEPRSVVELADRPIPGRPAAIVYALILLGVLAVARPLTYALWDTANREPVALGTLRAHENPPLAAGEPVRPAVVVLVDGLRADRAAEMDALTRLGAQGARATVRLPIPTVSKTFYHAFLTGVPPRGSGVRTNRFSGVERAAGGTASSPTARLDSLPARVRAHGGRCVWRLEDVDWLAALHADSPPDEVTVGPEALGAGLDDALARVGQGGRWLTVLHVVRTDATAHDHGARSAAHTEALAFADGIVARVAEATRGQDVALAVLSDHGHIDPGGHGGDEPVVRRVPLWLRAPGLDPGTRVEGPLEVSQIAPMLAAWMRVPPPRSAVAQPPRALAPSHPFPQSPEHVRMRARVLEQATSLERAELSRRRLMLVALWALLTLCALGATKRAFNGFDAGTFAAPLVWAVLSLAAHRLLFGRPFTLSALDSVTTHAARLAATSLVAAAAAIAVGTWLGGRGSGRPARTGVRRAAAAVALASVAAATFAVAWMGGAAGPWPLSSEAYYGAVIGPASAAGACFSGAAALLATAYAPKSGAGMRG